MSLLDKLKEIMFVNDEEDYSSESNEEVQQPEREEVYDEPSYTTKKEAPAKLIKSKTQSYSSAPSMNVILEKPTRYEQVLDIAAKLALGKAIVINLEETPVDIQRRIVDFMCGAAYAHGGKMKKVSRCTFVVAARGVGIDGDLYGDDFEDDRIYF